MKRETAARVVVNGRFLGRRVTGVERYGGEILRFIGSRTRVESTRRQGWLGHAWEQFILPARLDGDAILWSPANTGPLAIRDQALTIHDLSPLEHPEWFRADFALWYRLFLPTLARRVRKVFTPSSYVKQKVIRRFEIENVTVIPNGVDHSRFHPGAKQTRLDLPACYILFVGTLEPRKNLDLLIRAWEQIRDDFGETWLLIAGVNGHVFRDVHYRRPVERVRFLGYVDDETLAGLYANAMLFVLPSWEEGFGLPALEAMASGAPVIVSDGGALPEVVGEGARIFSLVRHSEPIGFSQDKLREESRHAATERLRHDAKEDTPQHAINQLTNALTECLSSAALRSALQEKGLRRAREFSWQRTAASLWKSLDEI